MDALAYPFQPRYQTLKGIILGRTPTKTGHLLMVCLATGQETTAPGDGAPWAIGQDVEVLMAAGPSQAIAVRVPEAESARLRPLSVSAGATEPGF